MAFCTNCGASMDPNAQFCSKCGKSFAAAGSSTQASVASDAASTPYVAPIPPPPAKTGGSGALKIVLVVVGVFVLLGILSAAGLIYTAYRMRKSVHVAQNGSDNSVDFGGMHASTSSSNAKELARKIGVDLYPGAEQDGDANEASFGKMTTATIKLTTSDSVDKVAQFYRSRYPSAMVSKNEEDKFSLVGNDKHGTLTITAESDGGDTRIEIAKVGGIKIDVH